MSKVIVGKHHSGLDGVRGLAVIMVMIFHASVFMSVNGDGLEGLIFILNRIAMFGQSGVDLFFVLSGFLITGILMETVQETGATKKFYIRRSLRIFPLYAVIILITIMYSIVHKNAFPDLSELLTHVFYLQNWMPFKFNEFGLLGHTWSLAVEEQFYLIWPFLLYFFYKKSPFHAVILCVVMIIISIVAKVGFPYITTVKITYTATISHMDSLIMGALCIVMFKHYNEVLVKYWNLILCVAYISLAISFAMLFLVNNHWDFVIWGILFSSIFYSYLVLQIVMIQNDGIFRKFLDSRIMAHIGTLSYGLYVFHYPVFMFVRQAFNLTDAPYLTGGIELFLFGSFATYACAFISYELYESKFLKLKKKWAPYEGEKASS